MAKNYSAQQFDNAFTSTRIQNWEVPKPQQHRPNSKTARAKVIVDDNYHVLPPFKREPEFRKISNFVGTWDMPRKLPSAKMDVRTGRSEKAFKNLQEEFQIPRLILSGQRPPERFEKSLNLHKKQESRLLRSSKNMSHSCIDTNSSKVNNKNKCCQQKSVVEDFLDVQVDEEQLMRVTNSLLTYDNIAAF